MDVAYNQHADRARRKNRSSSSLNHLSLAPLTAKLPLNDDELIADAIASHPHSLIHQIPSYIQGKSAPATPRLLARSPTASRSRSHTRTPSTPLAKSKSASHLAAGTSRKTQSGRATPRRHKDDMSFSMRHRNDSDWLLRTGALMSSEARESKGQTWLISRQSSTSLGGMDPGEDAFENELAREREITSRHASRRGSTAPVEEDASPYASRFPSRTHSRSHSMTRPRSHLHSPLEFSMTADGSYFPHQEANDDLPGPDFVNLDEKLEELEQDLSQDDEAAVRRLVRKGQASTGTWFGSVWSLFSVEEDDEDSEDDSDETPQDGESGLSRSRSWSSRHLAGISTAPEERMPPPGTNEGGWRDAAWLLSVATKVMF
ncbi:hypothetical protein F53441_5616 [Fusarium austroafricanum]|uniref:DUF3984 domain-containing protein n=1 Tax=Fusarium austroafricanum TaxID=2364996 RepID=A0A8H4NXG4_9HYPO|nr:hypothetical protein F53441_5616 [Fusarium austroafricanum]